MLAVVSLLLKRLRMFLLTSRVAYMSRRTSSGFVFRFRIYSLGCFEQLLLIKRCGKGEACSVQCAVYPQRRDNHQTRSGIKVINLRYSVHLCMTKHGFKTLVPIDTTKKSRRAVLKEVSNRREEMIETCTANVVRLCCG